MTGTQPDRKWWPLRWPTRLRGQAYSHLALVILIATGGILLIGTAAYLTINDREIKQREGQIREHYAAVLPRLEASWQTAAVQARSRIEFQRILEESDVTGFPKLTAFLNAQWTLSEFSNLAVLDSSQRLIYHHGSESVALKELILDPADWVYAPQFRQLYRAFYVPIWLGPRGQGQLVLFKSMTNAMLRELTIPQTRLALTYRGQTIGESHDTVMSDSETRLRIDVVWPGTAASQMPVLEVHRELVDLLPYSSFIIRPIVVVVFISLLLWLGLGRWLAQTTQRIESLGKSARLFALGSHKQALVTELALAHRQADEIDETANAFEHMAEVVETREQEQQSYLETLAMLEEAVIELRADGLILRASPGWNKLTRQDNSVGRAIFESIHPLDIALLQSQFDALLSGEKGHVSLRLRMNPPSGNAEHELWIECRLLSHLEADGQVTGLRGVLRDITQT